MNNLNSILIEGNLVRDPLHRVTPKGTSLCTFSLACNRYHKNDSGLEQEVSFFEIESWARLADSCYNHGRKGRGVRVIGRLKQDRWVDTEGKPRSRVTIVAEHVEFKPDFKKNEKSDNSAEKDFSETSALAETALGAEEETLPPEDDFTEDSVPENAEVFAGVEAMETVKF